MKDKGKNGQTAVEPEAVTSNGKSKLNSKAMPAAPEMRLLPAHFAWAKTAITSANFAACRLNW
jgi:hypothetical protein